MYYYNLLGDKKKSLSTLLISLLLFSKCVLGETSLGHVTFEVNTIATCNLLINGKSSYDYDLGVLFLGQHKRHKPFDVQIKCDSPGLSTALRASITQGELKNDGVEFSSGDKPAGLLKLLIDGDNVVPLDKTPFCTGIPVTDGYERICRLTPLTNIYQEAKGGSFDVGINIDVIIN
ncbi:hypothetical protein CA109_21050 [Salmonella enterica subsp. enterica serovar Bareilly]|nr:hypothetical protein [Salmonella enterica subsp. enterica serovar Bareilly]